jgi:hypothetical protein
VGGISKRVETCPYVKKNPTIYKPDESLRLFSRNIEVSVSNVEIKSL